MNSFERLIQVVARLRDPEKGCPWDLEQTPKTLCPLMLDEVYEVIDAIQQGDSEALCEELGDLLLHIVLQSQIAREEGHFSIEDVTRGIVEKLIRRHPHVFGNTQVNSTEEVVANWDKIKEKEGKKKEVKISSHLPSLVSAWRILQDYPQLRKSEEEAWRDLERELSSKVPEGEEERKEVLVSLFWSLICLSQKWGIHPEELVQSHLRRLLQTVPLAEK